MADHRYQRALREASLARRASGALLRPLLQGPPPRTVDPRVRTTTDLVDVIPGFTPDVHALFRRHLPCRVSRLDLFAPDQDADEVWREISVHDAQGTIVRVTPRHARQTSRDLGARLEGIGHVPVTLVGIGWSADPARWRLDGLTFSFPSLVDTRIRLTLFCSECSPRDF